MPKRPPAAGRYLIESIDAVLPLLTAAAPHSTRQLVEGLRIALAHTAARGDTCQVHDAAHSVRRAADLLLAGSTEQAREALHHARISVGPAMTARTTPS